MTQSVALLLYAVVVGRWFDQHLADARWTQRSPRAALWVWHASAIGVLAAVVCSMILLAHDAAEHAFAELLSADKALLHAAYASPGEIPWYWNFFLLFAVAGMARTAGGAFRGIVLMHRTASSHCLATVRCLDVALPDGSSDTVGVIDTDVPAVYCLGARRAGPRIQVTTGALGLLAEDQLQAAVAHERGHLHRHHHLAVLFADALASPVAWIGLLRSYPTAVRQLVELDADDHAAEQCGRLTVARALFAMSSRPPTAGMASGARSWTGGDPGERIRRLINSSVPRRRVHRLASMFGGTVLALTPVAASMAPALAVSGTAGAVSHHNQPTAGFDHH